MQRILFSRYNIAIDAIDTIDAIDAIDAFYVNCHFLNH